ncbi:MAG: PepSY domain-containing protein [Rhodobacteraceae bacterium]|nr:PepSY domain-containing protein [Paracoccaceae bacterium]
MKRTFKIAAVVMMMSSATAAFAAVDTAALIADLASQGYTVTEIKTGATTVKVEAVSATQRVEFTYDAVTGLLLLQESHDRDAAGTSTSGGTRGSHVESDDDHDGHDDNDDDEEDDNDDEEDDDESDDDNHDDDDDDDDEEDNDDNESDDDHDDDRR